VVYEKEYRLREIMKMMGLRMSVYWTVTYIFALVLYTVAMAAMWVVAVMFGFRFWTVNDFGPVFFLLALWGTLPPLCVMCFGVCHSDILTLPLPLFSFPAGNTMIAMGLLFSTFFNKTRTATVSGYLFVFMTSLLAGEVVNQYLNDETPLSTVRAVTIIPSFALFRGLKILSDNVSFKGPGLRMSEVGDPDVMLSEVYVYLFVQWFVMLVLAAYFETVLPSQFGVKRHPLFFTKKQFWLELFGKADEDATADVMTVQSEIVGEPADVAAERLSVVEALSDPSSIAEKYAAVAMDLRKVYPALPGLKPKVAVRNLSLTIKHGKCFGFLGPNGAGKSSTVHMMSGLFEPTTGTAWLLGVFLCYGW
jgi:ABC-type multidrug transport system fused ATPase/permease subunit